jgi:hypothetical protein
VTIGFPSKIPPHLYLTAGVKVVGIFFKFGHFKQAFSNVYFVLPKSDTYI